jgi:hypothetical protein
MNENKIPMKPLNMKSRENTHDTDQDQDRTNRPGKMPCRKKEKHDRKLKRKRNFGKTDIHAEA